MVPELMKTAQEIQQTLSPTFAIVSEDDVFLELEPEWDDLLARSPADSLFLTWAYVSTWWAIYGPRCELRVLTARDGDGRLIGLAPLVVGRGQGHRRHVRFLTFLGALGDSLSEYLDFVVLPGHERAVLAGFWRIMSTELGGWDVLRLPLVPAGSTTPQILGDQPGREAARLRPAAAYESPFIRLDSDWETYLSRRSKAFRKAFNSAWNRAHRRPLRVLHAGVDLPVEAAMDRLIALNRDRWGDEGLAFHTEDFRTFHRLLAPKLLERGELSLMILELDGEDAAIRYDFIYRERLWVFQGGWAPGLARLAPSKVLAGYSVQWCIENGVREYDFLAGDADHKRAWATDARQLVDLELGHPTSLRAKAYTSLRTTKRFFER